MKRLIRRLQIPGFAVILLAFIVAVVIATTPANFPAWQAQGPVAKTSSVCSASPFVQVNTLTPGNGTARFQCPSSAPALTVTGAGSDEAGFTLQPGQTNLGIVSHTAADCSTSITLLPSTQIQLSTGNYDYCINYSVGSTTSFAASSLTWSS